MAVESARASHCDLSHNIPVPDSFRTSQCGETRKAKQCDVEIGGEHPNMKTTWFMTSMLMVGETMGTGILGLPGAAATLGWTLAIATLVMFAFFSSFSGCLLAKVKTVYYPNAAGFADLANVTVGPRFKKFTRVLIIANWTLLLPYYIISAGSSMQGIVQSTKLCGWVSSLIAAALYLVPTQFTTLKYISYLCVPSTITIVVAAVMIIVSLFVDADPSRHFGDNTELGVTLDDTQSPFLSFFQFYSAFSSFVFAYQGQDMFVEMMDEMEEPREAAKAVSFSYVFMTLSYALTVIAAYGNDGKSVPGYLPDALKEGTTKAIVSSLILFHVLVAYVITSNLVGKFFYSLAFPSTALISTWSKDWFEGLTVRARWLLVQSGLLILAYLLANLIPAFGAMQGLIGSLCGAPIVFGYPPLFYLLAHRQHGDAVDCFHNAVCWLFLTVMLPSLTILGTIGAIITIVQYFESDAISMPFSC